MDSINTARNFFINQQGLSPDQADMIVSQGLQAYNEQIQPQSMMQMASGGRIGYGIGSLVRGKSVSATSTREDTGGGGGGGFFGNMVSGIIRQNPQMFKPINTTVISSRTREFIDLNQNGIDDRDEGMRYGGRIGYSEGGLSEYELLKLKELGYNVKKEGAESFGGVSVLKDILKLNKLAEGGIARLGYQMGGEANMSGMGMPQMNEQQALETIIQLLIEQGIDPETALQLAAQIIQIFAQGGAPAVEAFADQLEQEEVQAMAGGGIAGLYPRQGYFIGDFVKSVGKAVSGAVKGVAKAVKSVAKSTIGRAALTIAAATFLGPGAFGIQGLGLTGLQLGLATAGANLGLQALGGQKLNLLEAGLSGFGAGLSNPTVPTSSATSITASGVDAATGNLGQAYANTGVAPLSLTGGTEELIAPAATSIGQAPLPIGNLTTTPPAPTFFETAKAVAMNPSISGIKSLAQQGLTGVKQYVQDEPYKALGIAAGAGSLATLGAQLGVPRNEGEDDDAYAKRLKEAQGYITQYGRNLQIRNPYFYQREGAVNPFAPTMAANGGIIGYANGGITRSGYKGAGMISPRSDPTQQDELNQAALDVFKKPLHQLTPEEIDMLIEFIKEKFGKAPMQQDTTFAARGGSMIPPARQIEGGIIELDARKTGGYIPYGKKERVDDVPAMLAKDEFVFTSRAVKAAGDGSARRGAVKMYNLMKQLEAKGAKA